MPETTWAWAHPERWPWALGVFLLGLGLVWRAYGSGMFGRLKGAALCKVLLWALLALMVCDPLRVEEAARKKANELVMAVDGSIRMTLASEVKGKTSGEAVKAALDFSQPWMAQLEEVFKLRLVEAGDRLRGVPDIAEVKFEGTGGELLRTVRALRSGGAPRSLGAVVLLTDGGAADAALAEELVKEKGAAVFPVQVRETPVNADLALEEVRVAQSPFEDAPVTLTVAVKALGWKDRSWTVVVLDEGGKVLASGTGKVPGEVESGTARLKLTGIKPGVSFLRVRLGDGAKKPEELAVEGWAEGVGVGEVTVLNNERRLAVDRGMGPYRVLYVSGRPNWEYKFLRRALAGDAEIQLPALIRIAKREPKFEWRGRSGETSNPLFRGFGAQGEEDVQRYDKPVMIRLEARDAQELRDGFPKSAAELFGEYRAVVLDDVEAAFFSAEQQRLLERFVTERGGSVMMLGGQESFREGGYEHTPLGRMLPVYLDKVTEEVPLEDGRLNLTREGWLEPWLRLRASDADEEARLSQMPGFFAMNRAFSIKPGAALMATVTDEYQKSWPALVTQRFGSGRVTGLLLADLWRWGMRGEVERADLEKLWRQVFRWSVVDVPDALELQVTDAEGQGGKVKALSMRVRDAAFLAVDDALVRFEVSREGGEKVVLYGDPSLREAGLFEAEFVNAMAGNYRVEAVVEKMAEAEGDGAGAPQLMGKKATGWVHDPVPATTADLRPATDWMQRLAEGTGGQVIGLSEMAKLPDLLAKLNVPVMDRRIEPLWHGGWVFLLVLGLLVGEWILRRRAGLA
jgi:uncharacterized membrane protein